MRRRPLNIPDILKWARAYHDACGRWPTKCSGPIAQARGETWENVGAALYVGTRGLPGGSSLSLLLAEHFQVRAVRHLPPLSVDLVLSWADEYYQQHGTWPTAKSGIIPGTHGESWQSVTRAMWKGTRGFSKGMSLANLLAKRRGKRNHRSLAKLTETQILEWADSHFRRHGRWPTLNSGPINDPGSETWMAVHRALRDGTRGLSGGQSLGMLLAEHRGARNCWTISKLSIDQILLWVDAHHERTGCWPTAKSGKIQGADGELWQNIDSALRLGLRGLADGQSLARLLARDRGVRCQTCLQKLTPKLILRWADAYFQRTGCWPTLLSGRIEGAPNETWNSVDAALKQRGRGLRTRTSLARLLEERRGKRCVDNLPKLTYRKILNWADHHYQKTGSWPNVNSGAVLAAPGEKMATDPGSIAPRPSGTSWWDVPRKVSGQEARRPQHV